MGILSSLFGGGKSSSTNLAYPQLNAALSPAVDTGVNALNTLGSNLGSFDDYKKNAGFDFTLGESLKGITGASAARGMLNSGMTGKAFQKYGTNLTNQFYENWLNKLGNVSQLGLGAAGTLAGAGQVNTSKNSGGIIPGIASLFSGG
jgi:hypothetical protein